MKVLNLSWSSFVVTEKNNNNNSEIYLHDYNDIALQKHRKHDNYSKLID